LEIRFERVVLEQLSEEDFQYLDRCRTMGWWIPTPAEFGDQLVNQVYDIWKLEGAPETFCMMLTTFEVFPSGEKWMSINYIIGKNCRVILDYIHRAFFELAGRLECTEIIGQVREDRFFRFMKKRAKRLATLYKLERI